MIATYKLQLEADLAEEPVKSSTHRYPAAIDLFATDTRGAAPDVYIRFELREAEPLRLDVAVFRLTQREGGRGVRPSDQTDWPLPVMARNSFARFAQSLSDEPEAARRKTVDGDDLREYAELDDAFSQRREPPRSELERVAEIYRDNIDHKPTEMVQKKMTYGSRATAARRVRQARDANLLPKTSRGRKQA